MPRNVVVRSCSLPSIGAVLINSSDIIADQEINIINDIYAIDQLDGLKFTNIDVKKIFYFHIFKGICEYIDSSKLHGHHVIYYSSCDLKFLELTNYIENYKIKQFLDTLTKHIGSVMPVKFYSSAICFDRFSKQPVVGEVQEHINIIKNHNEKRNKIISTDRTRKYLTTQGFEYLNEKYFTKYKQMMFFYK